MTLSIVIAAWNGPSALRQCLLSLADQTDLADTEVIVASNFGSEVLQDLFQSLPFVRIIEVAPDATVPELRTRGIENSRGDIVALLEDHGTCGREWISQIRKAHELPHSIIGGAVENADGARALSWAVYFYDYGKYMLPEIAQIVPTLSGNNVSYKREALEQIRELYRDGFYETFANQELQRRGHVLYLAPSAIVYHNKAYDLKSAVADCYHHGRVFAARRVFGAPFAERVFRCVSSLLLPVILPARIVLRTFGKRRNIEKLAKSFPYLILLMTTWSYGEFCGSMWREGNSARKWK